MNKLSKQKRERLILVAIMTVCVCGGVWFLLIGPAEQSLKQSREEISNLEDQINSANRLKEDREAYDEKLKTLQAELDRREDGMAHGDLFFWFVNTINKFKTPPEGEEARVEIPQISKETIVPVGVFPEFPYEAAMFRVSGEATYYDLGRFIADFENAYPYISIRNLQLQPGAKDAAATGEKLGFSADFVTLIKPDSTK